MRTRPMRTRRTPPTGSTRTPRTRTRTRPTGAPERVLPPRTAERAGVSDRAPSALARCVGDIERFVDHVWARRSQVHAAGIPATDLLSLQDVDRLITSSSLRIPAFRLVRDGTPLAPSAYTTSGAIGGRAYDGLVSPPKVLRALDDGATLVLQSVHRYHRPLALLCRHLEVDLGHRCQANAYITPPGARGLALHRDPHDVLVLQSFGTKAWEVHATPWQQRHEPGVAPVEQLLRPGDVQYLPTGTPHAARAQQSLSGHITIGIVPTRWRDVLTCALAEALSDAVDGVDEAIPARWIEDVPGVGAALGERLQQLATALGEVDVRAVAMRVAEQFLTCRPPLLGGSLVDRQHLAALGDGTRLVRRPGAVVRLAPGTAPDRARLLLGDRELDVPVWIRPALTVVAARDELRPVDLADHLDAESRVVLCRRLVREGLLSPQP